jgi:hypothetical protein
MKRVAVHRAWAPSEAQWSAWVKPVLFASLPEDLEPEALGPMPSWLRPDWLAPLSAATAAIESTIAEHPYRGALHLDDLVLVIDLPGQTSTLAGVGVVDHGFRPVPLYNAVPSEQAIVDLRPMMAVLANGAARVLTTRPSAPPAFLLDANRMAAGQAAPPGSFDNRSVCWVSDFPSSDTLWNAGIRRALLIHEHEARPAADLEPTLLAWQRRGIQLWSKRTDETAGAAPFVLRRRSWLRRLAHAWHRLSLHPRSDLAYGMIVPDVSSS